MEITTRRLFAKEIKPTVFSFFDIDLTRKVSLFVAEQINRRTGKHVRTGYLFLLVFLDLIFSTTRREIRKEKYVETYRILFLRPNWACTRAGWRKRKGAARPGTREPAVRRRIFRSAPCVRFRRRVPRTPNCSRDQTLSVREDNAASIYPGSLEKPKKVTAGS